MVQNFKLMYILTLFLSGCIFISNSNATSFTGDAWIAQHFVGDEATDEYYLIIKNSGININAESVKLGNFSFKPSGSPRDFYQLTGQLDIDNVTWFEIDIEKSEIFLRKSHRFFRSHRLKRHRPRLEWIYEWSSDSLEERMFELTFRDENGNRYEAEIGFATFENPVENPNIFTGPQENDVAPVPEPATILLISTGLLGIVGYSRKKFKK